MTESISILRKVIGSVSRVDSYFSIQLKVDRLPEMIMTIQYFSFRERARDSSLFCSRTVYDQCMRFVEATWRILFTEQLAKEQLHRIPRMMKFASMHKDAEQRDEAY